MNPRRGWNPDLEESYLPEYIESKAENSTHYTSEIYLHTVKVSVSEPSPILRYSESTKATSFNILGFFQPRVKLGFDFPGVLPNQKFSTLVSKLQF